MFWFTSSKSFALDNDQVQTKMHISNVFSFHCTEKLFNGLDFSHSTSRGGLHRPICFSFNPGQTPLGIIIIIRIMKMLVCFCTVMCYFSILTGLFDTRI